MNYSKSVFMVAGFLNLAVLVGCGATSEPAPSSSADEVAPAIDPSTTDKLISDTDDLPPPQVDIIEDIIADFLIIPNGVMSMPYVAGDSIEISEQKASIILAEGRSILVNTETKITNMGDKSTEAMVGLGWRQRLISNNSQGPFIDLQIEGGELKESLIESDKNIHQPFRDVAKWAQVKVEPGQSAIVKLSYKTIPKQTAYPAVYLGNIDRFADNLKNMDWFFDKTEQFKLIANKAKSLSSTFRFNKAKLTSITIRSINGDEWIRSMSLEQFTQKLRMRGTYLITIDDKTDEDKLVFEYMPTLPIAEEMDAYQKMVKERSDDLRAMMRLSDLMRFAGDAGDRAKLFEAVLKAWEANAKTQMLLERNDMRASIPK